MTQLAVNTKIKCVAHRGAHTGTVVHRFNFEGAGDTYGVHWDGDRAKDAHRQHLVSTPRSQIREA